MLTQPMTASVYRPSGVKIEILSTYDEGDYFMVRSNTTGKVFFAHKDQVGELLHVSDATATRYLEILEKENKIKQVGKTGKGVSYTKI